jgi:hypothetical protein
LNIKQLQALNVVEENQAGILAYSFVWSKRQ